MLAIKNLINSKIDVKVDFDTPKTLGLHGIKKSFDKEIESSDTKFFRGSVRSGQRIEYEGSIVILGDVNDGAEIIAADNVIVVGVLRGYITITGVPFDDRIMPDNNMPFTSTRLCPTIENIFQRIICLV